MPFKKGYKPWNKGVKNCFSDEVTKKLSELKKGKNHPFYGKQHTKDTKKKMSEIKLGKYKGIDSPHWKGNDISKKAKHLWMIEKYGNSDTCEKCGKSGLKYHEIDWANKDHKYNRNCREDLMRLCRKCHYEYDIKYNIKRKRNNKGQFIKI